MKATIITKNPMYSKNHETFFNEILSIVYHHEQLSILYVEKEKQHCATYSIVNIISLATFN